VSEISLPVYVRYGDTELQVGTMRVELGISAAVDLDPSALNVARHTIQPEPVGLTQLAEPLAYPQRFATSWHEKPEQDLARDRDVRLD
jgi:hypothetical protein